MVNYDFLRQSFFSLWNQISLSDKHSNAFFKQLINSYSQENRLYYNLEYIQDFLLEFNKIKHLSEKTTHLEFSIWMHTFIYNPQSDKNTKNSIEIALYFIALFDLLLDRDIIQCYIMATDLKNEITNKSPVDCQLIRNIYLSKYISLSNYPIQELNLTTNFFSALCNGNISEKQGRLK